MLKPGGWGIGVHRSARQGTRYIRSFPPSPPERFAVNRKPL